jgi:MoaA/NifB/PqqE/SkfB family radical SAM enzyme
MNGTEPLLYSHFPTAIREIRKHRFKLQVTTNGILLSRFAADIVRHGVDTLSVSLDGLREVHDTIRGNGVFDLAAAGIDKVLRLRKRAAAGAPCIQVNHVISSMNYSGLVEFARSMIMDHGVDAVTFQHMSYVDGKSSTRHNNLPDVPGRSTEMCVGTLDPRQVDVDVLWDEMQSLKKHPFARRVRFVPPLSHRDQVAVYYNRPELDITGKKCTIPWTSTTVQPDGTLIIRNRCVLFRAGNLNERPLLDIWQGTEYKHFRETLIKHGSFPVCTRCCGVM